MKIIQQRKIFFILSLSLVVISIGALIGWGLKLGIDFKGGVLIEAKFDKSAPSGEEIKGKLVDFNLGSLTIQPAGENKALIRFISDDDNINEKVQSKLKKEYTQMKIEKVEFISSTISDELKQKAVWAIMLAVVAVALYIAWAFRKVSYPVESWKYGIAAVLALAHDVIITAGIFSFLGHYYNTEVNIPFIAALLTILGYSVNDTIVIFDRIRENLNRAGAKKDFENTINQSINESLARSINTSLTVVVVLLAIIFLGGISIKTFSLALLVGVIFGTYSSIFVASALLVELWKRKFKS